MFAWFRAVATSIEAFLSSATRSGTIWKQQIRFWTARSCAWMPKAALLAFLEGFAVVRVINLGSSRAPQPMARK